MEHDKRKSGMDGLTRLLEEIDSGTFYISDPQHELVLSGIAKLLCDNEAFNPLRYPPEDLTFRLSVFAPKGTDPRQSTDLVVIASLGQAELAAALVLLGTRQLQTGPDANTIISITPEQVRTILKIQQEVALKAKAD